MNASRSSQVPNAANILVIGGGAAGCVLANRLSEDPACRVILIEAGPDVGLATPPDITDIFPRAYANPDYFWPKLTARTIAGTAPRPFAQARLLGGGSSVMGMWALRGLAEDFNDWAATGVDGWSFADVLPYFRKLERDLDIANAQHGSYGPIPIRRVDRRLWSPFTNALVEAAKTAGYLPGTDINGSDSDGIYALPFSADEKGRASSVRYLDQTVRQRANLIVVPNCTADKLMFKGTRVTGACCLRTSGAEIRINADRTVLACGAIHSPALLLRSGVGSASALKMLGIDVVADNPGVGRNLQNHAFLHLGCFIHPAGRQMPTLPHYITTCLRLSSGERDAKRADLLLGFIARPGAHAVGNRIGLIGVHLYAPVSRGWIGLRRNGPKLELDVDFRLLEDSSDRRRLSKATRIAANLLLDPKVARLSSEPFILPATAPIRLLNAPGCWSAAVNCSIAAIALLPAPARRVALKMAIGSDALLTNNDEALFAQVPTAAAPMFHVAGSCAMGEALASDLAVRGTQDLYVADASAMPILPRANTNIPTIMLAERGADLIRNSQTKRAAI